MRAKPLAARQRAGVETQGLQVLLGLLDRFQQGLHPLLDGGDDLFLAPLPSSPRAYCASACAQALQHAVVVDDEPEVLAWVDAVGPRDGLHERVCLHGLVDVERGEALHVEASQPHGAHDGDAERDGRDS